MGSARFGNEKPALLMAGARIIVTFGVCDGLESRAEDEASGRPAIVGRSPTQVRGVCKWKTRLVGGPFGASSALARFG
jgi:hypothetical protein